MGYYFYPPPRPWQKLRRLSPTLLHDDPRHTFPAGFVSTYPRVLINEVEYSLKEGTLRISHRLGAESTASFELRDPGGTVEIEDHMEVLITTGDPNILLLFGGFIARVKVTRRLPSGSRRVVVDCHGYRYLAERRIASGTLIADEISDMFVNSVPPFLGADYVVAASGGWSSGGATPVAEQTFHHRPVSDIWDDLTRIWTGTVAVPHIWSIIPLILDPATSLAVNPSSGGVIGRFVYINELGYITLPSSMDVANTDVLDGTLEVVRTSQQGHNREYVLDAKQEVSGLVEVQLGDGNKRAFSVGYPIARIPTVEVDSGGGYVSKTVGVKGVDSGKAFYFNEGSDVVTQDTGETVLGPTHKVRITYTGLADLVVIASDSSEATRVANLEATTGYIDVAYSRSELIGTQAAQELARGLKSKSKRGLRISFETRTLFQPESYDMTPAYVMAKKCNVHLPTAGITNTPMFYEAIDYTDDPAGTWGIRTRVQLATLEAGAIPPWEEPFRRQPVRVSRPTNVLEVSA